MSKLTNYYRDSRTVQISAIIALFVVIVSSFAFLVGLATDWSFDQAFEGAFRSINIFLILVGFGWIVASRLGSGPVLLDAGAQPKRNLFLFFVLIYFVTSLISPSFRQSPLLWLMSQADILLLATFSIFLAFGRLQVYKRGVLMYAVLVPWHTIKSYTLKDGTFYFETDGWWFWVQNACVAPKAHVEAFEECLLEQNIPNTNDADSSAAV